MVSSCQGDFYRPIKAREKDRDKSYPSHLCLFSALSADGAMAFGGICSPLGYILYFEPVPHAPYGFNILRLCRIQFNFLPDFLNMHRNGGNITDGLHIPDL